MKVNLSDLKNSFTEFNVNNYVFFKPTEKGIEILRKKHDDLNERLKDYGNEYITEFKLDIDENGYCCMQMWTFMETFGPHLSKFNLLFNTNILFKSKDLKPFYNKE